MNPLVCRVVTIAVSHGTIGALNHSEFATHCLCPMRALNSPHPLLWTSRRRVAGRGGVCALILVPSRELVEQTAAAITSLAYYCSDVLRIAAIGGGSAADAAARLADSPDIIVTTPGRVVSHIASGALSAAALSPSCETLVIDEADAVLAFGGGEDIRAVIGALPRTIQVRAWEGDARARSREVSRYWCTGASQHARANPHADAPDRRFCSPRRCPLRWTSYGA